MQTEDVVFEGPIIAVNRGGAIVLVEVCDVVLFDRDGQAARSFLVAPRRSPTSFASMFCPSKNGERSGGIPLTSCVCLPFVFWSMPGAEGLPAWFAHVRWAPDRRSCWKGHEVQVPRGEFDT